VNGHHGPGDQRGIGGFPSDLGNSELSRADAIDFEPIPCRRCLQNCIDGLRSGLGTWTHMDSRGPCGLMADWIGWKQQIQEADTTADTTL
jgi:hypothetical protein